MLGYQSEEYWETKEDIPTGAKYFEVPIEEDGKITGHYYANDDPEAWENEGEYWYHKNIYSDGEVHVMERSWLADKWRKISRWRKSKPQLTTEDLEGDSEQTDRYGFDNPYNVDQIRKEKTREWMVEQAEEVGREASGEYIDTIEENKNNPVKATAIIGLKVLVEKRIPGLKKLGKKIKKGYRKKRQALINRWKIWRKKPLIGVPNAKRLDEAEQATAARLIEKKGLKLKESPHIGAEYIDEKGRYYDALGKKEAAQFWSNKDKRKFFKSIDKHLNKSNNFTVIDLTDFSDIQKSEIKQFLNMYPQSKLDTIIKIGF